MDWDAIITLDSKGSHQYLSQRSDVSMIKVDVLRIHILIAVLFIQAKIPIMDFDYCLILVIALRILSTPKILSTL